ncbi:hypothetical protein [Rothia sp. ZJ932]|uniref:hypothetical protein n=1 Tax=Rothia sp. ZJ932 TaxID=2810516 RepID=UPI00196801FF|nr:hypothetical protein [Rothia sp. ZJ932]QRZ61213.1 hypothetical protein JR346_08160 [Rothia sp. ZJ932]
MNSAERTDVFTFAVDPEIRELTKTRMALPGIFDGEIAALWDFSIEKDSRKGKPRIKLEINKTTYSSWLADHNRQYFRNKGLENSSDEKTGNNARQLAFAVIVEIADNKLVFKKRSKNTDINQLQFMPSANGNMQFRSSYGIDADVDVNGIPNPYMTMSRELSEELGLDIQIYDLAVIGLGQIRCENKYGTNLLVGLHKSAKTFEEIVECTKNIHPS